MKRIKLDTPTEIIINNHKFMFEAGDVILIGQKSALLENIEKASAEQLKDAQELLSMFKSRILLRNSINTELNILLSKDITTPTDDAKIEKLERRKSQIEKLLKTINFDMRQTLGDDALKDKDLESHIATAIKSKEEATGELEKSEDVAEEEETTDETTDKTESKEEKLGSIELELRDLGEKLENPKLDDVSKESLKQQYDDKFAEYNRLSGELEGLDAERVEPDTATTPQEIRSSEDERISPAEQRDLESKELPELTDNVITANMVKKHGRLSASEEGLPFDDADVAEEISDEFEKNKEDGKEPFLPPFKEFLTPATSR